MQSLIVIYDNACPMCTKFNRFVKRLDWLNLISSIALRNNPDIQSWHGLDNALATKQMASLSNRLNAHWKYGFVSIYAILLRLPLFWAFVPILPILFLFKITGLGQLLYEHLALKRKIIPLHCDTTSCKTDPPSS